MALFSKRETISQNIAFMAMMAAINVVLAVLSTLFPVASVFIMILLPFTSVIVTVYCKNKYYLIYGLATIGICLLATMWNMEYTIFYVIPSIITGFFFGLCIKKNIHSVWIVFITSIIQAGFTFAFIPLINFVYGDIITQFLKLFGLDSKAYAYIIVPTFIFFLALTQMTLSYLVISDEIKKFGYAPNTKNKNKIIIPFVGIVTSLLTVAFAFFYLEGSYLFLAMSAYLAIYLLIECITTKNIKYSIFYSLSFVISIVLIFALFSLIKMPYVLLLFGAYPFISFNIAFCNYLLNEENDKNIMEETKIEKHD